LPEQDKPLPNAFRLRRRHQSTGRFHALKIECEESPWMTSVPKLLKCNRRKPASAVFIRFQLLIEKKCSDEKQELK